MSTLTGWLAVIYAMACVLTGLVPALHYVPDPGRAHASVIALEGATVFGHALRSAHALSAHLCMGAVLLHVAAVLATRRERHDDPARWVSGVLAAGLLVALAFAGRVLPWDQHAGVSLTVGTRLIPGLDRWLRVADAGTLTRVLVLHAAGALMLGGVSARHCYNRDSLRTFRQHPGMVARVSLAALAPLALAAALWRMPIGPTFEPGASVQGHTSDWYVRWVEVLALRSGWLAQGVAVVLVVAALTTPWWARRVGEARARHTWWVVLGAMGLLSLVPIR